jgi:predicted secreted protein|nr:MAG TPA: major tail protein [Caudoviricetes sp.]
MGKAKTLNGKDLMLWIDGKVIALSTSCKINLVANTTDSATKDDGFWDASEIGSMSWSATNESVDSADKDRANDYVYDQLFDLFTAGQPVDITVGIPTNKDDKGVPEAGWTAPIKGTFYSGKAQITALDRDGTKGNNASVSVSLTGYGALVKKEVAE